MSYNFYRLIVPVFLVSQSIILIGCQFNAREPKNISYARLSSMPQEVKFPENLTGKIRYDQDGEQLNFNGTMTAAEREELLKLSKNAQYAAAIQTLWQKSQNRVEPQPMKETAPTGTKSALRGQEAKAPEEGRQGIQKGIEPAAGGEKRPEASGVPLERQKPTETGPRNLNQGKEDRIGEITSVIVRRFQEGFSPTGGKDFTLLVRPFTTLDGRQTMLSSLLTEEFFVQLSNSSWQGNMLKVCCNPVGELVFGPIDGIITGSLVRIGGEIKINARLVSANTHILLSAVSVSLPASETILRLFETELAAQRPVEGENLDARLDSLAWQVEQILYELPGARNENQRIHILSFSTLEGKKNFLGKFLAQECALRLSRNKPGRLVPEGRVTESLGREISGLSDLSSTELMTKLREELGINALVEGTVIDLGNAIKVNARVSDTAMGLMWGTASVEIPQDKRIQYLMGKGSREVVTDASGSVGLSTPRETPGEKPSQGEGGVSGPREKFFLEEDFSGPEVVHRLPDWGKSLTITSEGGKSFLASQEQDFVSIARRIDFPENFSIEFLVKGNSKYWNTLKFTDASGNEFTVDFQLLDNNCYVVLPGPKSVRVKVESNAPNKFKLVRKDGFYEVHVNDSLALAGPYSKYTAFKGFTITARLDQVRFTSFLGKAIRG